MTDLAHALADTSRLPDYGGRSVVRTTISIRNAGDGLSEGLGIDPQVLDIGDTVYVVLECEVHAHDHVRLKGAEDLLVLDQVLRAGTGTLVDEDTVRDAIASQQERIAAAKDASKRKAEAEAGTQRLPTEEELTGAHAAGLHTELVDGCPECDAETDAVAAEADPPPATPITNGRRRSKGVV